MIMIKSFIEISEDLCYEEISDSDWICRVNSTADAGNWGSWSHDRELEHNMARTCSCTIRIVRSVTTTQESGSSSLWLMMCGNSATWYNHKRYTNWVERKAKLSTAYKLTILLIGNLKSSLECRTLTLIIIVYSIFGSCKDSGSSMWAWGRLWKKIRQTRHWALTLIRWTYDKLTPKALCNTLCRLYWGIGTISKPGAGHAQILSWLYTALWSAEMKLTQYSSNSKMQTTSWEGDKIFRLRSIWLQTDGLRIWYSVRPVTKNAETQIRWNAAIFENVRAKIPNVRLLRTRLSSTIAISISVNRFRCLRYNTKNLFDASLSTAMSSAPELICRQSLPISASSIISMWHSMPLLPISLIIQYR